ncbi:hypothetical protein H6F94_06875 [Leptolyngbya sp. FACHB-261]|nr:hypothetical protein [Leptolyngbya sp. FACHB-261]
MSRQSRQLIILLMALSLGWTTLACGAPSVGNQNQDRTVSARPAQNSGQGQAAQAAPELSQLPNGKYGVQQVTYNDVDGQYSLVLLDTPAGTPPIVRTNALQMARLTDAEVSSGQKGYLNIENGQPSLHIPEDFRIEYIHNVTETQTDPQSGQAQTVVVRQEPSFWTPFAGAIAGQLVGNLLFSPRYYVPPVYQPGGALIGIGGYGNTYGQAVQRYQSRYQAPPLATRARRTNFRASQPSIRNSGGLRTRTARERERATGSGFGSSDLRRSNNRTRVRSSDRTGFGSGRARSSGGFGSRSRGFSRRR